MKILAIAWKDLVIRFSGWMEILFFLIMPVAFTYLVSGGGQQGGGGALPLLVVDQDRSELSAGLVSALQAGGVVEVRAASEDQARAALADRSAAAWLRIPNGYEAGLLAGAEARLELHKLPNNLRADAAERAVHAAASREERVLRVARTSLAEAESLGGFEIQQEREAYFLRSLEAARAAFASAPELVEVTRPEVVRPASVDETTQAAVGQMVTWVLIPLLGISGMFAYERSQRTLARLLVSPTRKATFLLGTIAGQLGVALVQMALLIGFGAAFLGVDWGRSPAGLALMALAFGLAAVALGTMLGTFIRTEKQASYLSITMGMVLALLGGCWYPLELFPPGLQSAVRLLPTTWAMQGFIDLAWRGLGLVEVLPPAGVLLGFAALFFLVGIARFRFE
jgi:ABC-2 type transport system permease protein